jgi:hypothetical protein
MKRFLRLSSLLIVILVASCSNPYKHLQLTTTNTSARQYKPAFDRQLYRCTVNGRFLFKKYHISGLLLFKELENGTVRAIYQNEMGLTFFDFEWNKSDSFQLNKIIEQLNKPALVKTLRKDMELLLMKNLDWQKEIVLRDRGNEQLYRLSIGENGSAYYVTKNDELVRIENAGKRSKVITMNITGKESKTSMPKKILINHHKANFTIELEKIEQDVNE